MRVALVTLGSILATGAVVANAFYQKKQFYPSVVYITKSNPSIAVLYAQVFVLVFLFGKAMRKIFFGQLRPAEIEHLIERFWYVITETCLAFTVFRDDFSPKFVALFTFLLFVKAFHWLIEDRVDYMERSPIITVLFHLRVISLLTLLGVIDSVLINHALKTTIASGASVQLVFGFEYAILVVMVVAIIMKYILHSIDYMSDHPWDNKNVYLLYAELMTGFVKCCLYIVFVAVMVKIHTFPLFAIRPMYLTIRAFKKSLSDVILSRRAIAYMNTRFADATEDELQRLDNTCIICREQMTEGKKLPCNHIFHTHCLRSWFQRQQSCPTCRMDVLSARVQQQPTPAPQSPPPPQQPQQQPGIPPHTPAFVGTFPPGVSIPQMYPPQSPQPGTHAPQTTSSTTSSTATSSTNRQSSFTFPGPYLMQSPMEIPPLAFIPPPPPFLNMAPTPIFPLQNVDLSTFSMDELQHLEGQERENVEARIRLLRNVHSLLDTVIMQLNQYSQAITAINAMSATVNATHSTRVPQAAETGHVPTISSANVANPPSSSSNTFDRLEERTPPDISDVPLNIQNDSPEASFSKDDVEKLANINDKEGESKAVTDTKEHPFIVINDSVDNELRRRRLAKFQNLNKENKPDELKDDKTTEFEEK